VLALVSLSATAMVMVQVSYWSRMRPPDRSNTFAGKPLICGVDATAPAWVSESTVAVICFAAVAAEAYWVNASTTGACPLASAVG